MNNSFQILIEEGESAKWRFSGYIPAFRVTVYGESRAEVFQEAIEVVRSEVEANRERFAWEMKTLEV